MGRAFDGPAGTNAPAGLVVGGGGRAGGSEAEGETGRAGELDEPAAAETRTRARLPGESESTRVLAVRLAAPSGGTRVY